MNFAEEKRGASRLHKLNRAGYTREMQNSSIIITGASDGIGRDLAHEFSRAGFALGLIARRTEKLEEVKKECLALGAKSVQVAAADVSDYDGFRSVLSDLDTALGGAGIFIANAGVGGTFSIKNDNWSEIKKTNDVNFYGAVAGLELMKERMWKRSAGTLVGVSSIAGTRGRPFMSGYCAGKSALSIYMESLRVEMFGSGLNAITVEPGYIATPLTAHNKGKMPFIISSEQAAQEIATQVQAGKKHIVVAKPYVIIQLLLRLLPGRFYEKMTFKGMHKTGRGDRTI